ncbi:MAG: hypothetical protein L3J71_14770 [Victivallaceae bacterium]|nr:hypothetical protein [Victivallaceae bacterium]
MKFIYTVLIIYSCLNLLHADGKIESHTFATEFTNKTVKIPRQYYKYKKIFNKALTLPEGIIVNSVILLGNASLGLTKNQVENLSKEILQVYQEIYADQAFNQIKSSLPYCFTEIKSTGHYFIYTPNTKNENTILFLTPVLTIIKTT